MSKLLLDDTLKAKLNGLTEPIEVLDAAGQTVGHFVPVGRYHPFLYEDVECPVSEDEIQRRLQEPGGRTLTEILADLERS